MVSETRVRELLKPFRAELSSAEAQQVLLYLNLLLRWNQKINLTAVRDPETAVTRHFGETLFLARHFELHGALLDIGSGAGFPGLALKIPFPELTVILLEPVAKKRAFLKEAVRVCGFGAVEVRPERLEEFAPTTPQGFEFVTSRAVGKVRRLVPLAARCLKPGGRMFLWLTRDSASEVVGFKSSVVWQDPLPIPLTHSSVILSGGC